MRFSKILFLIILSPMIYSSERDISKSWCSVVGGDSEFRTIEGTYVDCLTEQFAIEVEFDYKWKESIGQALHYAQATNKQAGILLIKRSKSKKDYHDQLMKVIIKYNLPIKVFETQE